MICLLDTCAIIHLLNGTLPPKATDAIGESTANYVSVVSLWEIAIKSSLGKLEMDIPLHAIPEYLSQGDIGLIEMTQEQALSVADLPYPVQENGRNHTDPFDRILVMLVKTNSWNLVSSDRRFALYDVMPIW